MTQDEAPANKPATCELCGEPMPPGEEVFKYHGYSGNCPKPPKETPGVTLESWLRECEAAPSEPRLKGMLDARVVVTGYGVMLLLNGRQFDVNGDRAVTTTEPVPPDAAKKGTPPPFVQVWLTTLEQLVEGTYPLAEGKAALAVDGTVPPGTFRVTLTPDDAAK